MIEINRINTIRIILYILFLPIRITVFLMICIAIPIMACFNFIQEEESIEDCMIEIVVECFNFIVKPNWSKQ